MNLKDNQFIIKIKEMIKAVGLPIKGSYRPGEVCTILGISQRSFDRMTKQFEWNRKTNRPKNPATLDSFLTMGQKRVRINELIDYITRNNTYERRNAITVETFKR